MRMAFPVRVAAQNFANAIHQRMIATDEDYRASVAAGETLRWAIPYQDTDSNGVPISSTWYVNVKPRCLPVLQANEKATLVPFRR